MKTYASNHHKKQKQEMLQSEHAARDEVQMHVETQRGAAKEAAQRGRARIRANRRSGSRQYSSASDGIRPPSCTCPRFDEYPDVGDVKIVGCPVHADHYLILGDGPNFDQPTKSEKPNE